MSPKATRSDPAPFPLPGVVDPWITESLVKGVFNNNLGPLNEAVESAKTFNIPQMNDWGVKNVEDFLLFLSGMLNWVPSEICSGKLIYNTQCLLYFILDQPPISKPPFSTLIQPSSAGQPLEPLSQWIVDFANKVGGWMSTGGSITSDAVKSFEISPKYNYDEAIVPPDGWKNFNQLFARHLKPGMRPVSAGEPTDPDYDRVVVYPADSTFDGAWHIDDKAEVKIKDLTWKISDLLAGSQYASRFEGGTWMHAFLNTFDYHRQHAPVAGTVVEANVIQGQAYLQVRSDPETGELRPHRSYICPDTKRNEEKGLFGTLDAPDDAGYQFLQARGCVIIKNPLLGYVAVLPIGMCQVSSVKLAWEPKPGQNYPIQPNVDIKKGDEISHFEFGGSDIVLVFQKEADVHILGAQGIDAKGGVTSKQKYLVGMPLGYSTKGLLPTNNGHTNGHH
ncbi:c2 domain-containing protein [Colletotrichum incanum]|uniref:C2 domain-containing protein n=1 Tax=Colletotrichum incanum TaxID=1573173 RepID=A0A166N956_COLIC|nr:c2 domain-containing protein [Colletotrichum incanum]OHW93629.1 phosphatidylserine decarboxylase [Colletotrichum incanum]